MLEDTERAKREDEGRRATQHLADAALFGGIMSGDLQLAEAGMLASFAMEYTGDLFSGADLIKMFGWNIEMDDKGNPTKQGQTDFLNHLISIMDDPQFQKERDIAKKVKIIATVDVILGSRG